METTTVVDAVTALQTELDEVRKNREYWLAENGRIGSQLIDLVNNFHEDTDMYSASDVVNSICEIIDYEPTKEISFTATITFSGRLNINPNEYDGNFDISDILSDAYVDINNGDVVIDTYDLENAEEC
jgi:hypothetical protein